MTTAELYARVVAAERNGVAVLPLLRETCEVGGFYHYIRGEEYHDAEGCPGWRAKPMSLETVARALLECGYWLHGGKRDQDYYFDVRHSSAPASRTYTAYGASPEEAMLHALAKAIGVDA